jgi:hypothetical protein
MGGSWEASGLGACGLETPFEICALRELSGGHPAFVSPGDFPQLRETLSGAFPMESALPAVSAR